MDKEHKNGHKRKDSFTESEIEQLFDLIHQRITSPSDKQKRIREKIRKLGFWGRDDWGIYDLHAKDIALLIQDGRIKIIRNL